MTAQTNQGDPAVPYECHVSLKLVTSQYAKD